MFFCSKCDVQFLLKINEFHFSNNSHACLLFNLCKILFKVKSISGQVHGQGKKRKLVIKFARRLLQMRKETLPQRLNVCFNFCFTLLQ